LNSKKNPLLPLQSFFARLAPLREILSRVISFRRYWWGKFFAKIFKTRVHIYREKKFSGPLMFFAEILRVL
jgi:hypothetical protein